MSGKGQLEDKRIEHGVAFLLRCQGASVPEAMPASKFTFKESLNTTKQMAVHHAHAKAIGGKQISSPPWWWWWHLRRRHWQRWWQWDKTLRRMMATKKTNNNQCMWLQWMVVHNTIEDCAIDNGSGGVNNNVHDGDGGHDNNNNNTTTTAAVAMNNGGQQWPQISINHCEGDRRHQDVRTATDTIRWLKRQPPRSSPPPQHFCRCCRRNGFAPSWGYGGLVGETALPNDDVLCMLHL